MAKLGYYNVTHKGLSYSRQLMLHTCPRKYEITTKTRADVFEDSITFAYGSSVGAGIQAILNGKSLEDCIFACIVNYDYDIFAECTAKEIDSKKSVFWAVDGVKKLHLLLNSMASPLKDWEVAYVVNDQGVTIPAIELFFVLDCGDGFTYEGHIDLVLQHKVNKTLAVCEIKTDGTTTPNPLKYENSNQALGYSMVLNSIASKLETQSAYHVFYFVYETRKQEYQTYSFLKQIKDRARWLLGLQSDIAYINLCNDHYCYPKHGQSCYNYNRPCKLAGRCDMSNEVLNLDNSEPLFNSGTKPDFTFMLDDMLNFDSSLIDVRKV